MKKAILLGVNNRFSTKVNKWGFIRGIFQRKIFMEGKRTECHCSGKLLCTKQGLGDELFHANCSGNLVSCKNVLILFLQKAKSVA